MLKIEPNRFCSNCTISASFLCVPKQEFTIRSQNTLRTPTKSSKKRLTGWYIPHYNEIIAFMIEHKKPQLSKPSGGMFYGNQYLRRALLLGR
ncbi:MAG: hypothetical protein IJ042_02815 [Butyricicoccus sp.]|nr:hypothetical protein [Butyricicoccus sp.]